MYDLPLTLTSSFAHRVVKSALYAVLYSTPFESSLHCVLASSASKPSAAGSTDANERTAVVIHLHILFRSYHLIRSTSSCVK